MNECGHQSGEQDGRCLGCGHWMHEIEAEKAEQALAARNVAWDAVIQPCYDELKKALGRDIECPAYIPDAIRELAALRGEPVAGDVYLCRATGEGTHDFRICLTIEDALNFYCEMFGADSREVEHASITDPDNWGGEGGLWYGPHDMYCASWEVYKVEAKQLAPLYAAPISGEPVAWGLPNSSITGKGHALMQVELEVPSDDQYGGAMWVPLVLGAAPISGEPVARKALETIRDECFSGHAYDIAVRALKELNSARLR